MLFLTERTNVRLVVTARNTIALPRLVQSVQWYRVDDWGNTEMINGATHQEYTVSCAEARFFWMPSVYLCPFGALALSLVK